MLRPRQATSEPDLNPIFPPAAHRGTGLSSGEQTADRAVSPPAARRWRQAQLPALLLAPAATKGNSVLPRYWLPVTRGHPCWRITGTFSTNQMRLGLPAFVLFHTFLKFVHLLVKLDIHLFKIFIYLFFNCRSNPFNKCLRVECSVVGWRRSGEWPVSRAPASCWTGTPRPLASCPAAPPRARRPPLGRHSYTARAHGTTPHTHLAYRDALRVHPDGPILQDFLFKGRPVFLVPMYCSFFICLRRTCRPSAHLGCRGHRRACTSVRS